jgi:prophage antirepressor-like protein
MNLLTFQNTNFNIIDQAGQLWLRAGEISSALGYADESSINRIFARRASEFSNNMSRSVKLTGQVQERGVRVFSLRGAHLLAMFARTKIAAEFRKWVLDILDRETAQPEPKSSSATNLAPLQRAISMLITRNKHLSPIDADELLCQRFAVASVEQFSEEQIPMAVEYIHKIMAQWELVERAALPAPIKESYHYPLSAADPYDRKMGECQLTPSRLLAPQNRQIELEVVDDLETNGHDVTGLKMRILALRDAVERTESARLDWEAIANALDVLQEKIRASTVQYGKNVLFLGRPNQQCGIERHVYRDQI